MFHRPLPLEVLGKADGHKQAEEDDDDEEEDEAEDKLGQSSTSLPMPDQVTAYRPLAETTRAEHAEDDIDQTDAPPHTAVPQPTVLPEFEEIMKDMGPEFAQATSGETLQPLDTAEASADDVPAPSGNEPPQMLRPEQGQPFSLPEQSWEEAEQPSTQPPAGGSTPPPRPPFGPAGELGAFEPPEEPPEHTSRYASSTYPPSFNWNTVSANTAPSVGSILAAEKANTAALNRAEEYGEKRGLRRGLVAGFITGYVVKAYLAGRKLERYQKATDKQLEARDEQITHLQREQYRAHQQTTAQIEALQNKQHFERPAAGNQPGPERLERPPVPKPVAEALPAVKTAGEEEQLFDEEGNKIVLQPGWHVERSSGGYSVVLDQHNRVVYDAIKYGEAFQRDQRREQLSADAFDAIDNAMPPPVVADGFAALPQAPMIASGQIGPSHELEPGAPQQVDLQHRLPKPPSNQIVSTVTSPWLWTAVAVLIIIYFIAALA